MMCDLPVNLSAVIDWVAIDLLGTPGCTEHIKKQKFGSISLQTVSHCITFRVDSITDYNGVSLSHYATFVHCGHSL